MFKHLWAIPLLATSAVHASACAVTERELLGPWRAVGRSGFFQQLEFERNGAQREFNSWLHDRPEILGGQWQLNACKLTILESSGPPQMFTVVRKGKALVLTSADGRRTSTFRKFEEKRRGD